MGKFIVVDCDITSAFDVAYLSFRHIWQLTLAHFIVLTCWWIHSL